MQDEAQLLAARMHHRRAARFGQEPPERLEVVGLERVDDSEDTRCGHLHEAELAAVGVLGDKLRVEAEMGVLGEPVSEVSDLQVGGDDLERVGGGARVHGWGPGVCRRPE